MTTTFTTHFRFGLPDFLSGPWHNDWYTLVQLMDQVLYDVTIATIVDVWANSTVYAVGNIRIDPNLGTIWTCLVAHTSVASPTTFATDRANHPTFWGTFTSVDGDKGFITVSGSNTVYTINDGVVSNAKLSNMGQATFKMRAAGAGTGVPIDGTAAQAKAALAYVAADITNLGTGIAAWLASPSSANLLAALTDETGTGAAVFANTPTLITPVLGAATGTSIVLSGTTPIRCTGTSAGVELGSTAGANTPFIDFHSSGNNIDYDARIIASSGSGVSGAGIIGFDCGTLSPAANDQMPLGTSALSFSDLFLASGGVINFNAGDVTVTHGANLLTFAGASNGYAYDTLIKPTANDGAALGVAGTNWSDLFLATGGVINWNSGDVTITHAAGALTIAAGNLSFNSVTGSFGYGTGAGTGTAQTQATSKATTVVMNRPTGEITLNGAALAASTTVSFTLTNSAMSATDLIILNHVSVGTFGSYTLNGRCGAGSGTIDVRNVSLGSLSEAIVIRYALIRGAVT